MGTLFGFAVGYMVGARTGGDGYARVREIVEGVFDSPGFKALVERGADLVERFSAPPPLARRAGQREEDRRFHQEGFDGDDPLRTAWRALTGSEAVRSIVATGLSVAGDLFERGMAVIDERRGRSDGVDRVDLRPAP